MNRQANTAVQLKPPKESEGNPRFDNSTYTIEVNGTAVRVHFTGAVSLNSRLADAFNSMAG